MAKGSQNQKKAKTKALQPAKIATRSVEIDGDCYDLAIIKKGVNVPIEEKIKIAKLICELYATNEYSLEECCKATAIDSKTFFNWRREFPEIAELYLDAEGKNETIYMHKLRERGRTNVERLLEGYTVELVDREIGTITDEAGNVINKMNKIKKRQVFIRPSVKLTETVLYNTDPRNFTRNPEQNKSEIDSLPTKIDIQIKGGSLPAVTSEDDIDQDV